MKVFSFEQESKKNNHSYEFDYTLLVGDTPDYL